jgi:hypothetical protein
MNCPAAQLAHAADPVVDSNFPAAQDVQVDTPVRAAYLPAEQPVQALAPGAEYVPVARFCRRSIYKL